MGAILVSAPVLGETLTHPSPGATFSTWKTTWRYSRVSEFGKAPGHWTESALPCLRLDSGAKGAAWFSARLPATSTENLSLYLRAMHQPFQVFLGARLVYEFGIEAGQPTARFLGFPWHMIPLPSDAAGREIRFVTPALAGKTGICSEIAIGPPSGLAAKLATDGFDRFIAALFALLCGIAGLVIVAVTRTRRPYLAFAGYSLSIGAWVLSNTSGPASKFFLIDSPRLWAVLDLGGLYLIPVFLAWFYRQIADDKSLGLRVLQVVQWAHFAFAAIVLPLGTLDVIHLGETLRWYNRFIPVFLCVLTVESMRRLRRGKWEERVFAVGVVLFLLFGVHDFLVGTGVFTWTRHLAHWGHIGLLGSLVTIVVVNLRRQLAKKAELERDIEINARATEKARGAFHDLKTQIASLGAKINALEAVPQDVRDSMRSNLVLMRAILSLQFENDTTAAPVKTRHAVAASVGGVLAVVDEDFAQLARTQGVEWELAIPRWGYRVFTPMRASDLQRILSNLADNAIDAAARRARRVVVSIQHDDQRLLLVVRDFGPGFSEQALRAYDRKEIYTSRSGGTGRGLLSVRGLVAAADGEISIHSDSSGVAATVSLPVCDMPEWFFDVHAANLEEVLVLDDDEEIAAKLAASLPDTRFRSFTDEADFLTAARATPGAFLFVDYGFAGRRTGLDLIKAEGLAERAVLFTGRAHFDQDVQARAVAAGIRIVPKECVIVRSAVFPNYLKSPAIS